MLSKKCLTDVFCDFYLLIIQILEVVPAPSVVPTSVYYEAHIIPQLPRPQCDPTITLDEGRQRQASASIDTSFRLHQQSNGLRDVSNEYFARQRQQSTPRIGAGKESTVDTSETLLTEVCFTLINYKFLSHKKMFN